MLNPKNYNIDDFLHDDTFHSFVLNENQKDIEKWEKWISANPEKGDVFNKAIEIIRNLNQQGYRELPFSTSEELDKFTHRLNHNLLVENTSGLKKNTRLLKIAASIIIILSLGLGYLILDKIGTKKDFVAYNEIITPKGSKTEVLLEDGSRVWLNSASSLKYPVQFKKNERNVYLQGEAYFQVEKDQSRPFHVKTNDIRITVLGTSFNVKSYPEDDIIETTLESGLVNVERIISKSHSINKIILKPNQKLVMYKSSLSEDSVHSIVEPPTKKDPKETAAFKPMQRKNYLYEEVDAKIYTSWKDNKLIVRNKPLNELVIELERWYNVNIDILDEELNKRTYTGTFENETIEQALKAIALTSQINYKIDKNNIVIYK